MMIPVVHHRPVRGLMRFVGAFVVGIAASGANACHGEDDIVIATGGDRRVNSATGGGIGAAGMKLQAREPQFDLGGVFDQHVFGRLGAQNQAVLFNGKEVARDSSAVERAIDGIRECCERHMETIDAVCSLAADQKRRLTLGLESDLNRVASQIELERDRYVGLTMLATKLNADRGVLEEVRDRANKCRALLEAINGPDSLFASLLPETLSTEQVALLDAWACERRRCRWQAMVKSVLVQLDESGLGLSQAQASALEASLVGNLPRLDVFHDRTTVKSEQRAAHFRMMLVTSRLGQQRDQWEALLDPRQNAWLNVRIESFGDATQIESMLVEIGILERDGTLPR